MVMVAGFDGSGGRRLTTEKEEGRSKARRNPDLIFYKIIIIFLKSEIIQ